MFQRLLNTSGARVGLRHHTAAVRTPTARKEYKREGERGRDALERDAQLAAQEARAALRERLVREARLGAHLDAEARDEQREHRDRLRLGEAAPDAAARAAAERQERVARVVAQEALRLERLGLVPVLRWWGRWASDRRRREREARGDVRLLCSPGVCTVT